MDKDLSTLKKRLGTLRKDLGRLRKDCAFTKSFEEKDYRSTPWFPAPQYKVETLLLGYLHKNQHCIGGGEGEATKKTICE